MTLELYGIKTCDTVRKALKALKEAGVAVTFIDARAQPLTRAIVAQWLDAVGAEALINRRGTSWRQLDDGQKAKAQADPVAAIIETPALFKRPVINNGSGQITVGWTKDVQALYL